MPDAPTHKELRDLFIATVVAETASQGSGNLTDDREASKLDIFGNAAAYLGTDVLRTAQRLIAALYLGGAVGQELDKRVNDIFPGMGGRNLATPSSGTERLTRTTDTNGAGTIPKGFQFATDATAQDPAITFTVDSDTAVGAADLTVDLLVTATESGPQTNVKGGAPGKVTRIISAPYDPNFNVANNAADMAGGSDDEPDDDFRARAIDYPNTLSKATVDALVAAALAVDGVATAAVVDREDSTYDLIVADSSGSSSPTMISNVETATLESVKAAGAAQNTIGSTQQILTQVASATFKTGIDQSQGTTDIKSLLKSYSNNLAAQEVWYLNQAEAAVLASMGDPQFGGDGRLTDFALTTPASNQTPAAGSAFHSDDGDITITAV